MNNNILKRLCGKVKFEYCKSKRKKIRNNMKRIHNIEQGNACFIIGNGPSLQIEDLERIQSLGYKTFGCNRLYVAFEKTRWRPDYYCISDAKLLSSFHNEDLDINNKCRFFPLSKTPKNIRGTRYLTSFYQDWENVGRFSKDASREVVECGSVNNEMIQIAYYMGFSEIYLIGIDFNYSTVNRSVDSSTYKYSGENNYFIKGYMKQGEIADIPNVEAQMRGYEKAREVIESEGKIIKNATRGGKLEVFERIDLDSFINGTIISKEEM